MDRLEIEECGEREPTLDTFTKALGELEEAHRTVLEVVLADGLSQSQDPLNMSPTKKMSEADRSTQVQVLEMARDAWVKTRCSRIRWRI